MSDPEINKVSYVHEAEPAFDTGTDHINRALSDGWILIDTYKYVSDSQNGSQQIRYVLGWPGDRQAIPDFNRYYNA